jgi:hypothetical protein
MRQRQYIKDIIAKFFPEINLLSISTPADPQVILTKDMCPSTPEEIAKMKKIKYREAVGSLLWLALGTRPDICYAVTQVAKFNENPGPQHWDAVVRIFRYLACTLDYAIEYSPAVPSSGIEESLSNEYYSLHIPDAIVPTGYVDSDTTTSTRFLPTIFTSVVSNLNRVCTFENLKEIFASLLCMWIILLLQVLT